jgi:large subunit ribosomal protein L28
MHLIPSEAAPEYPYGPRRIYKQSNSGLHGTLRPRVGCNVSEDHHVRTPRMWRPNIHRKRIWSDSLNCWVRTRLSMRVLRTIRKEGGLDNYVLGIKASRIKELGPGGWRLRWLVMQTRAVREKHAAERERLGVQPATADEFSDPALAIDKDELVHIMLDSATPGPLGKKSRDFIEKRAMQFASAQMASQMAAETLSGEFALGEEAELADELLVPETVEEEEAFHGKDGEAKRP